MQKLTFEQVWKRVKQATEIKTQAELSEVLGVRKATISDAKRRDSFPGDWCLKLYHVYGINPVWLADGVGPIYLNLENPQENSSQKNEQEFLVKNDALSEMILPEKEKSQS